jgi:uncharacterized protein YkwD
VRGGIEAERIEGALVEAARRRKMVLSGDGRLSDLAEFLLDASTPTSTPPASVIDAQAHRLGLIEPVPSFMVFGVGIGDDGTLARSLDELLAGAPGEAGYNRYGVAVVDRSGRGVAAVVVSAACAEIDPVPRRVAPGSMVAVRGRLRSKYEHPKLDITLPSGAVRHIAERSGAEFDFMAPIGEVGVHRVELLADGPYGPKVLANFPVFAGVDEPPMGPVAPPAVVAEPSDERAVAGRLFALLNDARRSAGLSPLAQHGGLGEVAAAHSQDMVGSGFFGHVSPGNGDLLARVRKRGLGFLILAENLGRGSTAEEVNSMLLDSPAHRANALDANYSYVGIGVSISQRGGHPEIVATEEFAGVSKPLDVATAPDELLRIVNDRRSAAGAQRLEPDAFLTEAARSGVTLYFQDPPQPQSQILQKVTSEISRPSAGISSPIAARMRATKSFLLPVISMDHAAKSIDQLFDPTIRYIGIGVARGTRPETGPDTTGVLVVLGWPRNPR